MGIWLRREDCAPNTSVRIVDSEKGTEIRNGKSACTSDSRSLGWITRKLVVKRTPAGTHVSMGRQSAPFLGGGSLRFCVSLLGRRVFGTAGARAISSSSLARASARLTSCVRCTRDVTINPPSCVARLRANARRRCRTLSGISAIGRNRSAVGRRVETLLTFWPPGIVLRQAKRIVADRPGDVIEASLRTKNV